MLYSQATRRLYTLGDLLPAIDKKLRPALEVEVLTGQDDTGTNIYQTVPLKPYLDELTRIAQSRNVFGCHFNALSFDLLDSDALAFGRQVSDLMDVLVDTSYGWPKNGKSGRYWATTRGSASFTSLPKTRLKHQTRRECDLYKEGGGGGNRTPLCYSLHSPGTCGQSFTCGVECLVASSPAPVTR